MAILFPLREKIFGALLFDSLGHATMSFAKSSSEFVTCKYDGV